MLNLITRILRGCARLRFKALGHATIKDIPTDQFNNIINKLIDSGWKKTYVYDGFDAWIDYGKVKLKSRRCKLTFEWDNWTEGSIEGPTEIIEILAAENNLQVTNEWRWAVYDEKP
jgi:hypothetical protein